MLQALVGSIFFVCSSCSCETARHHSIRSIYPEEFKNFAERMERISKDAIEKYKLKWMKEMRKSERYDETKIEQYDFDLDVMKPLLDVLLDTNLGAEVSRER